LAQERPGQTLQATALVNEAYLRLVDVKQVSWQNRAHFFGVSAQFMRRILVERARTRRTLKRGSGGPAVTFDEGLLIAGGAGRCAEGPRLGAALPRVMPFTAKWPGQVACLIAGG
jgi:RNA polymerase sigma-70 factor (ECF subfamily)